jgi:ethanolamine utilization protein EutQ (cupin superfamily)
LTLKDEITGVVTEAETGSMIWIPKGAKMSVVRSKGVRVVYVEQQYRKAQYTA